MGVEIITEAPGGGFVVASERLYLTADGERLVHHGDPDARSLFCTPGKRVPTADAERFGLLDTPRVPLPDEALAEDAEGPVAEDAEGPVAETAVEPPAEKKPATRTRRKQ